MKENAVVALEKCFTNGSKLTVKETRRTRSSLMSEHDVTHKTRQLLFILGA